MRYAKKPLSKTAVVFVFSQFPIGKVKVGRRLKRCARSLYVSIPYGKGKARFSRNTTLMRNLYQFPMGKVKS